MSEAKWGGSNERTTGISSESLNAGANKIGSEIDNATNKDTFADFELQIQFGVAPTDGNVIELWLVYAVDGTNYADGGDAVDPKSLYVGNFPVRAVTTAQRISLPAVPLSPYKFKPLLKSESDQNATASSVTLRAYAYNVDPDAAAS